MAAACRHFRIFSIWHFVTERLEYGTPLSVLQGSITPVFPSRNILKTCFSE